LIGCKEGSFEEKKTKEGAIKREGDSGRGSLIRKKLGTKTYQGLTWARFSRNSAKTERLATERRQL